MTPIPLVAFLRFGSCAVTRLARVAMLLAFAVGAISPAGAADEAKRSFDLPAGDALRTLKQFSDQAGRLIVYPEESVAGVATRPVKGAHTVADALARMLEGTGLRAAQDEQSGAFAVNRTASPATKAPPSSSEKNGERAAPAAHGDRPNAQNSSGAREADDPIRLSPFTVVGGDDRGYQAQSSLGGSRLKTNLKEIASPTTAFTEQFLIDTGLTNTSDLARYMVSTEYELGEDEGSGQNDSRSDARLLRIRGLPGGQPSVNFFKTSGRLDTFSTERIDQSRGPNAILFGIGNPGGIINATTKRAVLNRSSGSVAFRGFSDNGLRREADYNQSLIPGRLALRIAGVSDKRNSWRNYEYTDDDRGFATVKWKITKKTELNVEAERGHTDKITLRTYTAFDAYTPWRGAGRAISATPNAAQAIQRLSTAPWIVYDSGSGQLMNWRNATVGTRARAIEGQNLLLSDFSVLPPETGIYGPGFDQGRDYTRLSAFLTHAFTPDLNLEVAGFRQDDYTNAGDPQLQDARFLQVDTNPLLPTGAMNPNAGRAYFDGQPMMHQKDARDDSLRAVLAYDRDLGKRWGRHRLAGVFQYNRSALDQRVLREHILVNAPTPLTPENASNRVWRRTYVDIGGPSERIVMANFRTAQVSGLREAVSGQVFETAFIPFNSNTQLLRGHGTSAIGMLQSHFLNDRLHTVIGTSRDEQTDYTSTQFRPTLAPFTQGGVLTSVPGTVPGKSSARSVSFSAVLRTFDWLYLTYSQAANSGLPNTSGLLPAPNARPPRPQGVSRDFGFKLDLPKYGLFLTTVFYETSAERDFSFSGVRVNSVTPIWLALEAAGVLRANQIVLAEVADRPTGHLYDSKSKGLEVELTANPTKNLRVFLNYSAAETTRTQLGKEMMSYVAGNRDFWLRGTNGRILLDGSGNLAPTATNGDAITETVAEQVAILDQLIFNEYTVQEGRKPLGQIQHKFNVRSNYDFTAERLKGWSIGAGARYLGSAIVAYTSTADATGRITQSARYGSPQLIVDANAAYRRKLRLLGRSIGWALQLNVDNVFDNHAIVRIRETSAGNLVNYRFNAPLSWSVSSRFSF